MPEPIIVDPPEDPSQHRFEFRPLTPADLPMLHQWLCRPHIAAIWGGTTTLADVCDHYLPTMAAGSPTLAYIAWRNGEPIGFIQSYVAANAGDGWWPDEHDPGVLGIDQFLADETRLNKGLGTGMVRAFVDRLFSDPATTRVQSDPSPTNGRAIRCYEKAGFRRVGEVTTPDGVAVLMKCEGPDSESDKRRG